MSCGPGLSWQSSPSWGPNCTPAWWLYPGCLQGGCEPAPCTPWPTCYPFPTGGWFPNAAPLAFGGGGFGAPLPGAWMGSACPQMLVGGEGAACCAGCKSGGACEACVASPEPCCQGCAKGEGCNCRATTSTSVGVTIIEKVAYQSDAIEFDAAVQKLNVDLQVALKQALAASPTPSAAWVSLSNAWGAFYPEWTAWFATDPGGILGTFQGASLEKFNMFRKKYNDVLELAKQTGVNTQAAPIDLRSNAEKAAEEITKGATSALGSVTGTLTTVLLWTVIAGAVGLILYYAGPPLLAAGIKAIRK